VLRENLDLRVHDRVALDEIELYAEVLSAVAASDRPLTAEELDQVLGVRPVAGASVCASLDSRAYITSVPWCVKPSDSYIPIAGALDSSTYSMTSGSPRERR
jgi:hypothetical protein